MSKFVAFPMTFIRSLSTAAKSSSQTPVKVFGLQGRYATALYTAAVKNKKLDAVEKDVNSVNDLVTSNKSFKSFLTDPLVSKNEKKSIITEILTKMNCNELTKNFFALLAENNRFKITPQIFKSFATLMSATRGEVVCRVTTANPLDNKSLSDLKTVLQGFVSKEEVIKLETSVDPDILGGMTVEIGDRYVDMSTASKIKRFNKLLAEPIN